MKKETIKKIVLAYSGALDTSVIIPWLKENYNDPEIIAVAADVGQGDELEGLEEKAIKTGASKLIVADLTDEMCDDIIVPSIMMGAKYEKYLLGTAFARPIIAKKLAEIALAEGADAIAHGCTGKGKRSGPVRARHSVFCPRHDDHRAVERVGDQVERRRDRLRRGASCAAQNLQRDQLLQG